jgi:hypothetical protein
MGQGDDDGSADGLVWERMLVGRQPGERYSRSRKSPGDLSPLTRDEDNELGHVVMRYPDDSETESRSDEGSEDVSLAAVVAAGVVVLGSAWAVPKVRNWWVGRRSRSRQAEASSPFEATTSIGSGAPLLNEERVALPEAVVVDPIGPRVVMSSSEAQQRLIAAVRARDFSDEQIRLLRNAEIADGAPSELSPHRAALESGVGSVGPVLELEPQRLSADELLLSRLDHADHRSRSDAERVEVVQHPAPPAQPLLAPPLDPMQGSTSRPIAQAVPADPAAAPGWYADPWRVAAYRYWDGRLWTHHVA